jgi:hypothetical protein
MTARSLESSIARLLTAGTYVSVALIAIGVVALAAAGTSPLDGAPAFDLTRLVPDLVALQPAGFLWLGIMGVARDAGGAGRRGARRLRSIGWAADALVSALILVVIALASSAALGELTDEL